MKILHWDEMFHPSFGYQINLLTKFQVKQGHEVIIMSSDNIGMHPKFSSFGENEDLVKADAEFTQRYGVEIIRVPWYTVISGRVIYKKGYIKKIKEVGADMIMCHTNDTLSAMTIAKKYKELKTPIVFDNHMLEMSSKNPLKKLFRIYFRSFITPLIIKNKWTVIRTQDDKYVNKCLGIPEEQTPFISFGSDTTLFYPNIDTRDAFRQKYSIDNNDFVIVYTGKLDDAKGGRLLATALKEKFNTTKNVIAIIVGNFDGKYGSEVEQIFADSHNKIIKFHTQKYTNLAQFYQMADLCVFARQCSLSFYDAQACGLPVVSENNNINIERCSHGNGFTFRAGDVNDFREYILKCIEMDDKQYRKMAVNAYNYVKQDYDYKNIAERYTDVFVKDVKAFTRRNR